MTPRPQRSRRALFLLLSCLTGLLGMTARPPADWHLWAPQSQAAAPDSARAKQNPWVLREQSVMPREDLLALLCDMDQPLPSRIVLDLFDGSSPVFLPQTRTVGGTGSIVVTGPLAGEPANDVTVVIKGQVLIATFRAGSKIWMVEHVEQGKHRLVEIDPEKYPKD